MRKFGISKTAKKNRRILRNAVLALILIPLLLCAGCFIFLLGYTGGNIQETIEIAKDFIPHDEPDSFVKKHFLSVEIKIPHDFLDKTKLSDITNGEDLSTILTDEAREAGVQQITQNEEGSVSIKLSRKSYDLMLKELRASIDESIQELIDDDSFSFISIKHDSDMKKFDIYMDSDELSFSDSFSFLGFCLESFVYQIFDGVPESQIDVVINYINNSTGKIIDTFDLSSLSENSEIPDASSDSAESDDSIDETSDTAKTNESNDATGVADMSGDYIGDLSCPLPPLDSVYRIYSVPDYDNSIVLYVENIDDGNFRFHFTKAVPDQDKTFDEDIIFLEHIAHYNGEGYYEYIGQEYHLYFRYRVEGNNAAAQKLIEVYGLESLYDATQYSESTQYNGLNGNIFRLGMPYAG